MATDLHTGCICKGEMLLCHCGCGVQIALRAKFVDGKFTGVLPFTRAKWDRLSEELIAGHRNENNS
jgi:hypothetical protein